MVHTFYTISVILSGLMQILFMFQWRKSSSSEFIFTFALVPVVNAGYVWLARAQTLEAALNATKLTYVGGCFLHMFLFIGILSLCNFKVRSWVRAALLSLSSVLFGFVLTIGHLPIFYKSAELAQSNGVSYLIKDYGPMHTVFYVYMIGLMMVSVVALIVCVVKHPEVSLRNLFILIVVDIISVLAFFGGRMVSKATGTPIEVMPAFYVSAEFAFLILYQRLRLYSISAGVAESLIENGEDGLICFDREKHYLVCNNTAKKIIPSLVRAKADSHLSRDNKEYTDILTCLNRFYNYEISKTPLSFKKDGKIYELHPDYMRDNNRICGFYILIADVTKERIHSAEMEKAADAARAADKAKSNFLAQMSHEIRTPINTILGMNEIIQRECGDKEILEYSDNIQNAGKTLMMLINSILDFSKIEDGKMEIVPVRYSTADMINSVISSVSVRAREKGLNLKVSVNECLPSQLYGDDVRVSQVILNLVTNAIKYTEKGSVTLTVGEKERDAYSVLLYVEVKDTGIGIRKEDMKKLFESFSRLEEKRNRNVEGTGLGMSIVTGLLDMMGGKLHVESEYGKGSTFSFTLKQGIEDENPIGTYKQGPQEIKHVKKSEDLKFPDAKVLVVDDNVMNLKVASRLLALSDIRSDTVSSGPEAIEAVKKKEYAIIFLDHMMSGMDGIETLANMKKENMLPEKTRVIALTANAIIGAKEQYISSGFDDYLSKPIEVKALQEIIKKHLDK